MSEKLLLQEELDGGIIILTLNRPESYNSLNTELILLLSNTFKILKKREDVHCVILTGNGKLFSSGVDLTTAFSVFKGPNSISNQASDPLDELLNFPKPLIGALNGPAITGGFELALACDMLICTEHTFFQDTHTKFGIIPSWGLTQKLSRLIGKHRANEVSLFGERVTSEKAKEWGLVNYVLKNKQQVIQKAVELGRLLVNKVPQSTVVVKDLIRKGYEMNLKDGLEYEKKIAHAAYKEMTKETFDEILKKLKSKL